MLQTILSLISNLKIWLYGLAAVGVAGFLTFSAWQSQEIRDLEQKLKTSQLQAIQGAAIVQLREQEIKSHEDNDKRAEQIRQTPKKDDGTVSSVLKSSLDRL